MKKEVNSIKAICQCGQQFELKIPEKYQDMPIEEAINIMYEERDSALLCGECI